MASSSICETTGLTLRPVTYVPPPLPLRGLFFAVYSTPVGIPREIDYRSRTCRFSNKVQLAFSAGVRLVSIGENQSD